MTFNSNELDYLWEILLLGLVLNNEKKTIKLINFLYENNFKFSSEVHILITQYLTTREKSALWNLALYSLKNFHFDLEKQVRLVALLSSNSQIDLKNAFNFLDFKGKNTDEFDASIRDVVDVCWLLKEDETLGFLNVESDNLLANTLSRVNNIAYAQKILKKI